MTYKVQKKKALELLISKAFFTLRGLDLNQRPSGYEFGKLCLIIYYYQ